MSNTPEDIELSRLQRAAEFMQAVRQLQAKCGKSMRGGTFLTEKQEAEIKKTIENSHLVQSLDASGELAPHVFRSMQVFEEMCRRHDVLLNERLRPSVMRLLASEFVVNGNAMPTALPKDLEALTALQGAIWPELAASFGGRFDQAQSYLQIAATFPSAPRDYLSDIAERHKTWHKRAENSGKTKALSKE